MSEDKECHCHEHGEECHCHDHDHEHTSIEEAGGCAAGFTGTIENGRLSCTATAVGSGTDWVGASASATAKGMIDVTNYAKCTFIGVSFTHGDGGGHVSAGGNVFCGVATGSGTGAVALDISEISGEVSIGLECRVSTPNRATATISCSKIYLE